jgi:putative transposase
MRHGTKTTICKVHLIPLPHLPKTIAKVCETIRKEAGRCWSDIVKFHKEGRDSGQWPSCRDLEHSTKGLYSLHSQTIQGLCQKLDANVKTASLLRRQETSEFGHPITEYPIHPKEFQTPLWKDQAIKVREGHIVLPNGKGNPNLILPLPEQYHDANIRKAELLWRDNRYELCITFDTGVEYPKPLKHTSTAGVDLGEINVATICAEDGDCIVISGRKLRHSKQLRNKRHKAYDERIKRCKEKSKRWRRLKRQKARASAKLARQQRDFLHKSTALVVAFCTFKNITDISVGDVRYIADGVDKGHVNNQKISQWPHGQTYKYIEEKAKASGMRTTQDPEDWSSRTCPVCGHVLSSAPRGRIFKCLGCGSVLHRDAVGAANICSRAVHGSYGHVSPLRVKHLRPVGVVRATTSAYVASCLTA